MPEPAAPPTATDVLVVGAGPAGSAAAAWAARAGLSVVLADAAVFPRDKPCGDGLTPRAIAELERLGLGDWVRAHGTNHGLRATGFGVVLTLPWPGGSLPAYGGAVPRMELDARIREVALKAGAVPFDGARAVSVERDGDRVTGVVFARGDSSAAKAVAAGADAAGDGADTIGGAAAARTAEAADRAGTDRARTAVAGTAGAGTAAEARTAGAAPDGGVPGGATHVVRCRRLVVADGARSPLGRMLGREWHRDTAYGVAARGYIRSGRSDDPWISSHLELRGEDGEVLAGYGWVFPLGDGEVNIGVGTLATARRPAQIRLRSLIQHYADARRDDWQLDGPVRLPASALLPMGGAVSHVAGHNWALIGDAAGCVNPLNGEGIDYGLETGRLVAELMAADRHLGTGWPATLRRHYGEAFSIARRLAGLITLPRLLPVAGPVGMRSRGLMTVALRVMGNLVTDEDRDLTARAWRAAGRASVRLDDRPPFE